MTKQDEQHTPQPEKDELTDADLQQTSGGAIGQLVKAAKTSATVSPMDPLINTAGRT